MLLDSMLFNFALGAWCLFDLDRTASSMLEAYLFYLAADIVQLAIAQLVQPPQGGRWSAWLYLPLLPLYKGIFRAVRLYAYLEELILHASYADSFAPEAVSKQVLEYDNRSLFPLRRIIFSLLWPFRRRDDVRECVRASVRARGPSGRLFCRREGDGRRHSE
jgi:hypothetical protein